MDKIIYQVPKMDNVSIDLGINGIMLCASVSAQTEGFTEYELFAD